ncbi:MAG TPA: phage tail sheath subtilisin-like domain-containing protein [Blastocatellia bacterium]|nr:phage tail sheath subtilisin-like domain-containing protein [Blastocatellia bacterium]
MPEYLAPGVYVEEVSFRSKSIEGVPTSTTGFAGMTRYGPVQYPGGPSTNEPRLITSYTEFERVYGGLEPLSVGSNAASAVPRTCYLAHAARAFFENGGKRLYVSRVIAPRGVTPNFDYGAASKNVTVTDITGTWRARWPGLYGNVLVETRVFRSKNLVFTHPTLGLQVTRARPGSVVEILQAGDNVSGNAPIDKTKLAVVMDDGTGKQKFIRSGQTKATANDLAAGEIVQLVEMQVVVRAGPERVDVYDELAADPAQRRFIGRILERDDPEDENAIVWFDYDPTASASQDFLPAELIAALRGTTADGDPVRLTGGHDGALATPDDLAGKEADPDNKSVKATGLEALGEITDIAIVALPDAGAYEGDVASCEAAAVKLIGHAERMRYRIAVVDGPRGSSMNEIRAFRGKFDSKYAAMYHPWIEIFDPSERPSQGAPPTRLLLPPSAFAAGIYARSDIERGVHKAPANEVVRGLTRFESNINKARQDVLNPEGINALRFFEGRGNRVWGARTMSSDPEWKYVNVRRLFIYIEHSIDKGTQWAVFEPNGPRLWANIRQTIEDFLLVLWRDGALLGDKPEQAYFVRCDRTTMTQNDLDNGRLICLIGVAPVKPAEFVIFRIGQWTADSKV